MNGEQPFLTKSKHSRQRMSQRGINGELIEIALEYGTTTHDGKRRLDKKVIKRELTALDRRRKALLAAEKRGGIVIVVDDNTLITTYGLEK